MPDVDGGEQWVIASSGGKPPGPSRGSRPLPSCRSGGCSVADKTMAERIMDAADDYQEAMTQTGRKRARAILAALVAEACEPQPERAPRARLALARFGALIVREYSRTDYGFVRTNGPQLDWAAYHAGVTVEEFGDLAPGIWAEGDALIQGMADGQEVGAQCVLTER